MQDDEYQEWVADLGARLTQEDLERLLTRARQASDEDLRRLVKTHLTLRRLVRDAVLPLLSTPARPTEAQRSAIDLVRTMVGPTGDTGDA